MPFTLYQLLWLVLIYAFFGWCAEVAFAAVKTRQFVNRGFLNGPVCPIYGFGVVLVLVCLTPLRDTVALLFVGSVLLTSLLEFVTGFVLEKLFHQKWWDYSHRRWNLKGYICLPFSLLWGVACVVIVKLVHPPILWAVDHFPALPGRILLGVLWALFLLDTVCTLVAAGKLSARLRALDAVEKRLRALSDGMGENLSDGVLTVVEKQGELRDQWADKKQAWEETLADRKREFEALLQKRRALVEQKSRTHRRLARAFPHLQSGRQRENWERIRRYWESVKEERRRQRHAGKATQQESSSEGEPKDKEA